MKHIICNLTEKEIPRARDLMSFDYFGPINIGTILYADSGCIKLSNGMNVCDIGSKWHKTYLEEMKFDE